MRVAYLNQDAGIRPGARKGAVVHVEAIRRALRGLGAEVLAVDEPGAEEARRRLDDLAREAPLDLVYERYALGAGCGSDWCQRNGVPHVLEVNAPLLEEERRHRAGRRAGDAEEVEARVLAGARLVLAVSTAVERYCLEGGARPGSTRVRPNAIDPERFHPGLRPRPAGQVEGPLVVGFHGRLRPWHGFPLLVEACAAALGLGVELELHLVGEGDFAAEWSPRLPAERVREHGWLEHERVGEAVARFDVLPLTYRDEGHDYFSPLKLLEAMAVGAVPVVPALGDLTQVVEHGRTGLLVVPGRVDQVVDALVELDRRPAWRAELSRAAAREAAGRTWRAIAAEVLELAAASRTGGEA